jgi:hypothetical protein
MYGNKQAQETIIDFGRPRPIRLCYEENIQRCSMDNWKWLSTEVKIKNLIPYTQRVSPACFMFILFQLYNLQIYHAC